MRFNTLKKSKTRSQEKIIQTPHGHKPSKTQHQVEGGLLLDVVIRKGAAILQLLASKDQALLIRWDPLLVLDLGLDIVNGVTGLDVER